MSEKTKVLFLLEAFDKGGIEKVTLDIVNNLNPEKYDITVQTFWYGGHCQSQVKEHVKVIPFFFKHYVRGIIRLIEYLSPKLLYRLFVRGTYDVEIAASDGGAAKVISGSTNSKAKKICWVHMDVVEDGSKLKEFRNEKTAKTIYEKFDRICCVSEPCLSKFQQKFGTYSDMRVTKNPLPVYDIISKAEEFVPDISKKNECTFVTVGRLGTEKGYDRLIESCAELHQSGVDNFKVYIVGDGVQADALKEMVCLKGLQDKVFFMGFQKNPYPYIRHADWYICSSRDEAFPLTIGESIILHTPVIGTKCSGVVAWLGNSEYGMVVENSTKGIYEGMLCAINMADKEYDNWIKLTSEKSSSLDFETQFMEWENGVFENYEKDC